MDFADALARYLSRQLGRPATVQSLARIPGGASRETYRFVLDDGTDRRHLILRRDPPSSLIETDRRTEFAAIQAFRGSAVPVPECLWVEDDPSVLGGPFFVMTEIRGAEASPRLVMLAPYAAHHDEIARQKWTLLGVIAGTDPWGSGFAAAVQAPAPADCWLRELDHWAAILQADALEPQPVQQAAIRWMRRNPPPAPARLAIVHGDYRTGNILVDAQGRLRGILDWEMAHLGDPLEDLAWSLNRVWCFQRDSRRGGLAPRAVAIAHWEQGSGLRVDPVALHWWELLACLKGQAIWLSAAREFAQGRNRDSIMAVAAWMQGNAQDRATLELMGHLPGPGLPGGAQPAQPSP